MTAILGRTGNLVGFSTGRGTTPWDTEMEAALRKMDAMLASTVVAITNTLPGSANEGDLYLVGTLPTGVAAGWANRIARWRSSPAGWEAYQPMQGWIITIVGESTNKVRRYNGTAWVALAADAGAEPYAGTPAQTSFWRSTAAGVRAWVQLVAADITDLATTLAGYLTKANPTYTGRLTGPTQFLEADEQILLTIRRPGGQSGRIHGIAFQAQNNASAWVEFGRVMTYISSATAGAHAGGMRLMAYKDGAILQALEAGPDGVRVGAGLPLQMGTTTVVDASRNVTGTTIKGLNAAGTGIRPAVALADGTFDDQDAATFRGTIGALPTDNPDFSGALKQGGTTRITSGGGAWLTSIQSTNLLGAGDRPVAADLTGTLQPKTPDQFRNMIFALAATLKGAANGVAELGADVKVPVAQLPSAALLALGANSTTAHRGDHGTTAYNHSQLVTGNPHGTTAADVGAAKAPSKVDISASTTLGSIDASAIKVTATDVILTLSGGVDGQGWDIINPTASTGIAIPSGATLWKSIGSDVGPTTIALGGGRPIRITRINANTWTMLGSQ